MCYNKNVINFILLILLLICPYGRGLVAYSQLQGSKSSKPGTGIDQQYEALDNTKYLFIWKIETGNFAHYYCTILPQIFPWVFIGSGGEGLFSTTNINGDKCTKPLKSVIFILCYLEDKL